MITQKELKELLHYDPDTGVFTRLKKVKGTTRGIGDQLGSKTKHGYMETSINRSRWMLHRLAWLYVYGELPEVIDHIDGDGTNNKISNLRDVTQQENMRNAKLSNASTSGFTGVSWDKNRSRWKSNIKVDYKYIHLGRYETLIDAVIARIKANERYGFHELHGRK